MRATTKITAVFFCFIFGLTNILNAQGHYAEIDDIKMYYEIHGSGEPLLLIHGGTGAIEHFKEQIPVLSKNFKLIVPDYRAHGRTTDSDKPLSVQLIAADINELLNHLNIDSTHVAGFSMGGSHALELAVSYPNRVRKLILISANYTLEGVSEAFINNFLSLTPEKPWPNMIERYKRLSPTPENFPVFLKKLQDMLRNYKDFREDDIKNISKPALVMAGDRDVIKFEHTISLYQLLPKSNLCIVPKAGHSLIFTRPKLVNSILLDFLLENK